MPLTPGLTEILISCPAETVVGVTFTIKDEAPTKTAKTKENNSTLMISSFFIFPPNMLERMNYRFL